MCFSTFHINKNYLDITRQDTFLNIYIYIFKNINIYILIFLKEECINIYKNNKYIKYIYIY